MPLSDKLWEMQLEMYDAQLQNNLDSVKAFALLLRKVMIDRKEWIDNKKVITGEDSKEVSLNEKLYLDTHEILAILGINLELLPTPTQAWSQLQKKSEAPNPKRENNLDNDIVFLNSQTYDRYKSKEDTRNNIYSSLMNGVTTSSSASLQSASLPVPRSKNSNDELSIPAVPDLDTMYQEIFARRENLRKQMENNEDQKTFISPYEKFRQEMRTMNETLKNGEADNYRHERTLATGPSVTDTSVSAPLCSDEIIIDSDEEDDTDTETEEESSKDSEEDEDSQEADSLLTLSEGIKNQNELIGQLNDILKESANDVCDNKPANMEPEPITALHRLSYEEKEMKLYSLYLDAVKYVNDNHPLASDEEKEKIKRAKADELLNEFLKHS
jgi:hypothetical protein